MSQRDRREPKRGEALAGLACDVCSGISGFTALSRWYRVNQPGLSLRFNYALIVLESSGDTGYFSE